MLDTPSPSFIRADLVPQRADHAELMHHVALCAACHSAA
jgi:hypothetical protein